MAWRGHEDSDLMFADPLNVRGGRDQSVKGGYDPYRSDPFRGGQRYPPSTDSPRSSHSTPSPVRADRRQAPPEPEVEDYGVVGNFLWSLVSGGKQCCSMRDRAKPSDLEAKARLPETNRPPGHPDRVNSGTLGEEAYGQGGYPRGGQQQQQQQQQHGRQQQQQQQQQQQGKQQPSEQRPNTPKAVRELSPPGGRPNSGRSERSGTGAAGGRPAYHGQDLASSIFDTHEDLQDTGSPSRGYEGRDRDRDRDRDRNRELARGNESRSGNATTASKPSSDFAAAGVRFPTAGLERSRHEDKRWDDDPFLPSTPRQPATSSHPPPQQTSQTSPSPSAPAPTPTPASSSPPPPLPPPHQTSAPTAPQLPGSGAGAGKMPTGWKWPSWALNFKKPSVEVWVFDDDTGEGRWVNAEPQSRVVDKSGNDAYLCAEYEWDGEYYMQDFGPEHVRKRGLRQTVEDELKAPEPTEDMESTRLAPGRTRGGGNASPDLLEDTRLAPGRSRADNGAGVLPFLNER